MSAGWVAGSTRARLLVGDTVGRRASELIARSSGLREALGLLSATKFQSAAEARTLRDAQRLITERLALDVRQLAGWLPPRGIPVVRSLAGWFEIQNVEDRLAYLNGGALPVPFVLGSLALAWPRLEAAETPPELRQALQGSVWGDPGGDSPYAVHLGMRVAWARQVMRTTPEARNWAGAALALLIARERFLAHRPPEALYEVRRELGGPWRAAASIREFVAALSPRIAVPFDPAEDPCDLWRSEIRWWRWVAGEAAGMVNRSREGRAVIVGAVALLASDAMQVSAALAAADWQTPDAMEAFDGLA